MPRGPNNSKSSYVEDEKIGIHAIVKRRIEHRSRASIVYLISNWGWKHKIRIFVACWMYCRLHAFWEDQTDPKFVCGGPNSISRTGIGWAGPGRGKGMSHIRQHEELPEAACPPQTQCPRQHSPTRRQKVWQNFWLNFKYFHPPPWWESCSRRWRREHRGIWRWSEPTKSCRFPSSQTSWCLTFQAEK